MKKIILNNGIYAIVDNDDFKKVSKYKWRGVYSKKSNTYYAARSTWDSLTKKKSTMRMHRLILKARKGEIVDHINHNGLDNRKSNIRIVDNSQNQCNRVKRGDFSSKYKGVYRCADKWRALICFNKIKYHLGVFIKEIDAAKAYNKKAKELFKEYAFINKIPRRAEAK